MRGYLTFLISVFLFLLVINANISAEVTGEAITGNVTSSQVSMSIQIGLSLSIISPENETYLTNTTLLLNYTSNGITTWYKIDNSNNITITSPIYFNTTEGSHTLYLYSNSSVENATQNVTFYVNSSLLTILYDEYKGALKGNSTDFDSHSYEDLQNLDNIILEHSTYGKILFNEAINVTSDLITNDSSVDIDSNSDISLNRIEINPTALPNFNKAASIWIYNLAFSEPRILKDGEICPSSICTFESYTGGTLKFDVTGFSVYSAEETPVTETVTTGGGGGGRRVEAEEKDFSIDKESIKVSLKQGETKKETIKIKNIGNKKIKINLSSSGIDKFLKISETEFELEPKEEKTITLDFIVGETTIPNLYLGNILVKKGTIEEKILIAIEVESKEALFDIKAEIPKKFLYVLPGEELLTEIKLYNLGEIGKIDVNLEYIIKDEQNEVIISDKETVAVETQAEFTKQFKIPKGIKLGEYVFYVKATYNGKVASASAWFNVGKKPFLSIEKGVLYIIFSILIVIILITIYQIIKHKKLEKFLTTYKKEIKKQSKKTDRSRWLAEKVGVLKKAYTRGHIKKDSYEKVKDRIKKLIQS